MTGRPLILLVEDEPTLSASLRLVLLDEGFDVLVRATAADGFRGLERVPAAVLLNLGLPDEDGVVLCRRIRSVTGVPILIVSARNAADDVVLGLAAGADDYLAKPFVTTELADRIRALIARQEPRTAPHRLGDLGVGTGCESVLAGGTGVPLSKTERELLCALCRAPDHSLGEEELMRRIWGRRPVAGTAVLDARLRSARDKLAAAGSSVTIRSDDGHVRLQQ
jgi:two-component system response regulator MtrA